MTSERDMFNFVFGDTLARDFEPQEDLIFGGLGVQKPKPVTRPIAAKLSEMVDWDDEEDGEETEEDDED